MATIEIGSGVSSISSGEKGTRFLLAPGQRGKLSLVELKGTEAEPIIVQGDGTHIVAGGGVGMYIDGCEWVCVEDLDISGGTNSGITARRGTNYLKLARLKIHDCRTGVRVSNMEDEVPAGWEMGGFWMHHCEFWEFVMEAAYVGHGTDQVRHGTTMRNVHVWANVARRCGADGFQFRECPDADVHDNLCEDIGLDVAGGSQGGAGLIIGHGASGEFYRNTVIGADCGVQCQNHVGGLIHHNVFAYCGYVRNKDAVKVYTGAPVSVFNNTIVSPAAEPISLKDKAPGDIYNNLIVDAGGRDIQATGASVHHNVFVKSVADAKFVDPANQDYRLQPGSPAGGAASDGGDCGAYQLDEAPPEPPPPEPPTPSPEPPPDPPTDWEPAVAELAARVGSLEQRVWKVEGDVSQLRSDVAAALRDAAARMEA